MTVSDRHHVRKLESERHWRNLLHRSLGFGYAGGAAILMMLLFSTLASWRRSLSSVLVADVVTRKAEVFYRVTILFSQTLGTALGD